MGKKRLLIDGAHQEETRLVLTEDDIVESFEYTNKNRASIKGNIYLAKVTRVEPSLQAAFIDYGGDRHGFLPLPEIHPDYYQLPKSDKEELLRMMEESRDRGVDDFEHEDEIHGDGEVNDDEHDHHHEDKEAFSPRPSFYRQYKIQEVIKKEQVLLVQVAKEGRGNKGVALTTYISLAGRYCVLLPKAGNVGGV